MSQTVLLVDDDQNILTSLQRSLHKEDYGLCCATSAEEALAILESQSIDLVVSDQNMPGMKGTDFLAEISRKYPEVVRFILTGKATLDTALEAINKGAISRFFVKPCDIVDLAISIREALQQKALKTQATRLMHTVQKQSAILDQIEEQNPGITHVKRDEQGIIELEETPADFDAFMKSINDTLEKSEH